ncbi:hydroxyacid dehydrogenase [archaeon]|nr:hydroxyacid dehydrogenase [archaeon]
MESWEKKELSQEFPKDELFFSYNKINCKNAVKYSDLEAVSIFIYSKIDSKVLDCMPKLKFITTRSTGFNHIDLEECKKRKITVCNVPSYGENTVAEHAFALILNLSRKMFDSIERTKHSSFSLDGLRGFDLQGKTLGIVGCGKIGQHLVRMAKGFEMKVQVFDVYKNKDLAKELSFKYVTLNNLLKNSDVISLHVPLNKHTKHLINKEKFKLMKPNCILINTSRGGVIDTDALVWALKTKKIVGAGLDVLEEECNIIEETQLLTKKHRNNCNMKTLLENHMLLNMSNVVITPHNAFNTKEALQRILDTTVKNFKCYKKGRKVNVVKC